VTAKRQRTGEAPLEGVSPGEATPKVDGETVARDIEVVGGDVAELAGRLAEAETKRDEYLADLQRLAADFDNYRKRSARDQEALVARAHERLVKELLPVLDDLERALDAAEMHDEATVVEGVRLVQRALLASLEREGLAEIEADGAFDPHVHEALLAQPGDGAEPGSVLQVVQKGYRLGDRVLRPARVVVAE
jgi:molecular chaperone GrpE